MSDNLKPCPFCGGDVKATSFNAYYRTYWTVHCECDPMMHTCDDMGCCDCDDHKCGQGWEQKEDAIKAWNTRACPELEATEKMAERVGMVVRGVAELELHGLLAAYKEV